MGKVASSKTFRKAFPTVSGRFQERLTQLGQPA